MRSRKRLTDVDMICGDRPAATGSDVPVLLLDETLARLGGDTAFYRELLNMLLEDAPGQVFEIKKTLEAADAGRVERIAHNLKGAAASLGAGPVRDAALQLELLVEDVRLTDAPRAVEEPELRVKALVSYIDSLDKNM